MNRRSFFGFLAGTPLAVAAGKVALASGGFVGGGTPMLVGESMVGETILPLMPRVQRYRLAGEMNIVPVGEPMAFEDAYPPQFYDHDKINPPGSDTMDMVEFEAGKERHRLSQVAN